MKGFEWDDSIALGIPAIDNQHKLLFGWVNALNEAIISGDGHEKVGEIIVNLISYVTVHFSDEERLLLSYKYPELISHRKEHDYFVTRLQEIQTSFNDGHEMEKEFLDFMVEWLVCHIKGTDQEYSRFIHAREE
ncbi:MAG: bacteriohemerythrin [Desulfuromonadaceae bacterium]|nr:bacteriohemerythrin [Desulfuromonadaceae bacterium]